MHTKAPTSRTHRIHTFLRVPNKPLMAEIAAKVQTRDSKPGTTVLSTPISLSYLLTKFHLDLFHLSVYSPAHAFGTHKLFNFMNDQCSHFPFAPLCLLGALYARCNHLIILHNVMTPTGAGPLCQSWTVLNNSLDST